MIKTIKSNPILLLIIPVALLFYLFFIGSPNKTPTNNVQINEITSPSIDPDQQAITFVSNLREVKDFKARINGIGKTKPVVAIDSKPNQTNNYYLIQVFEDVSDGGSSGHTATFNWYRVYPDSWKITREDLSQIDKWDVVSK